MVCLKFTAFCIPGCDFPQIRSKNVTAQSLRPLGSLPLGIWQYGPGDTQSAKTCRLKSCQTLFPVG